MSKARQKLFRFSSCWVALPFVLIAANNASAQKQQWTDAVYARGRWQAGKIVAPAGKDSLALIMRVDYFASPPRWRAEVRRTIDGISFGEPVVLLGEKQNALVITPLGATPLERHVLGKDSIVRAAVVFDTEGKRVTSKATSRVTFRRDVKVPTFSDDVLNPGNQTASRQIISKGLASVGDQRSASVVATAGARGVDKVKTARGEITIKPDSLAVVRMERFNISTVKLEDFLRAGGLGLYKEGAP